MNKMIEEIKELHPDSLCLYKVGAFYHAYGKDAIILSYLFNYKIKELGKKIKNVDFQLMLLIKLLLNCKI